jgi:signal peptidase II
MTRQIVHEKTALIWVWLSLIVVALDQLTKWYVVGHFELYEIRPVGPFLDLTRLHNQGAAFGLLAEAGGWQRWFFLGLAGAIGIAILAWLRSLPARGQYWLAIGLALILGGALGNLYDRLTLGTVVDFMLLHYRGFAWPAFNVADSAICVGAALLIADGFRQRHAERAVAAKES